MIVAVEGPDRSGKTTLWLRLQEHFPDAVFVPSLPHTTDWAGASLREAILWKCLYENKKLYICDRFFAVSDQVYGLVRDETGHKKLHDWCDNVFVVYLDVPLAELERRLLETEGVAEHNYYREIRVYKNVLKQFKYVVHVNIETTVKLVKERYEQQR